MLWHHRAKVLSPHFNPFPLFHFTQFYPFDIFSETHSVVNTVWPRHLSLSCYLGCIRQTHRAAVQMPACEYMLSAWQPTSGCLLHLVFHYSFIPRTAAGSEERTAEQSRAEQERTKEPFPPTAPFDIDFGLTPWNNTLQPQHIQLS